MAGKVTAAVETSTPVPMPVSKQVVLRIPLDLLERVDAYVDKLNRQTDRPRTSQAAVCKLLIERGLDAVEADEKPTRKR